MLYYETVKRNSNFEWIVFIHGIAGSTKTWYKQKDEYSKKYNLLFIDLPGHGNSQNIDCVEDRNEDQISNEICKILDKNNIKKAHFESMSLGTIVLLLFMIKYPDRVLSAVMAGAITKLNTKLNIGIKVFEYMKNILSQNDLCKMFSMILMPKKNHKKSRDIFVREGKKSSKKEFVYWAEYIKNIKNSEKLFKKINKVCNAPILFVMGEEDHMFLNDVKRNFKFLKNSSIKIIKKCGHVCNIEKYKEYNQIVMNFHNKIAYVL